MASYEIGIQVRRLVEKILSEMVIKSGFDKSVIDSISEPIEPELIVHLFKGFLEAQQKEERYHEN